MFCGRIRAPDSPITSPYLASSDALFITYGRGEAGRDDKPPAPTSESGNAEAAPNAAQPLPEEPLAPQPTPVEPVPEVAGASKPVEETLQVCPTLVLFGAQMPAAHPWYSWMHALCPMVYI